jgi:probable phosphomutase (TIGR03848 family)
MAIFLLIRHGQNDSLGQRLAGRLPDVHLNEEGKAQADRLGKMLETLPIKAVYASPLERTLETAQSIARPHHLPVETLPALIELDFGDWQGREIKQLKQQPLWVHAHNHASEHCFPGGETFKEAQSRIVKELHNLNDQFNTNDPVVCVTHGDVIRLAVAYFMGLHLDHFHRLRISPASVTVLHIQENKPSLGPINYVLDFPTFPD